MRKLIPLIAGGLVLAGGPALAAHPEGEEQLERALSGRVAGEPVQCINLTASSPSRVIDRTAIVFRVGGTLYVNRPRGGAESLDSHDIIVHRGWGGVLNRLCNTDTFQMRHRTTGMLSGLVFLGDFVPYRRVSNGY